MAQPFKHPVSGIFYLRRKVPTELRVAMGRREIKWSLKTRDAGVAKSLFAAAWLASEELIEQAKAQVGGQQTLTDAEIQDLAAQWLHEEMEKTESVRNFEYHLVEGPSSGYDNGKEFVESVTYLTLGEAIEQGEEFDLPALAWISTHRYSANAG